MKTSNFQDLPTQSSSMEHWRMGVSIFILALVLLTCSSCSDYLLSNSPSYYTGDKSIDSMIRDLERESNLKARQDICSSISALEDARTLNLFVELLETKPDLGFCPAIALSNLNDSRAIEPLMRNLYRTDKSNEEVLNGGVLLALVKIGDKRVLNFLIKTHKTHRFTRNQTGLNEKEAIENGINVLQKKLRKEYSSP